ncbi:MAG: YceI family protein [Gammaproteobacteria bacterium]
MTKSLWAVALLALPFAASAADELEIDGSHTYPNFTVSHRGLSMTHGSFNDTSGTVVVDRGGGGSKVRIVVQTASIDTGHQKRDEHLRSADFLDVAKYPAMTYESTKVTFTGAETAKVEGNLSLHGVTRPLALDVTRFTCTQHPVKKTPICGFSARGALKRSDFGMSYGVPNIGDDIELRIEAEAQAPKQDEKPKG